MVRILLVIIALGLIAVGFINMWTSKQVTGDLVMLCVIGVFIINVLRITDDLR